MSKTQEMNVVYGPLAVVCKVIDELAEKAQCGRRVWSLDDFTKLVEGRIPLIGVLVEKGDSVPTLNMAHAITSWSLTVQAL